MEASKRSHLQKRKQQLILCSNEVGKKEQNEKSEIMKTLNDKYQISSNLETQNPNTIKSQNTNPKLQNPK